MALNHKQQKAIAALLSSRNVPEAAKAAGVGERTLWRWMTEPEFAMALTHAEGVAIDTATRRLVSLQDSAIDVLQTVLNDAQATPYMRLRAAGMVLDALLKLRELRNFEARLAALEAAYQHGKQ